MSFFSQIFLFFKKVLDFMTDSLHYQFPPNGILPKLTEEVNLKRARVNTEDGFAIRVSSVNEGSSVDLTTLETSTGNIETSASAVAETVGSTEDTASVSTVVGLLKKIDGDLPSSTDLSGVTGALGTTSDTSSDSTVIGLLKSIASKLQ